MLPRSIVEHISPERPEREVPLDEPDMRIY